MNETSLKAYWQGRTGNKFSAQALQVLSNLEIGQWCEFNYMERGRQGGYRHPTFHRIREAK